MTHSFWKLQVPQRVLCTGFSNGGAYAQLCGIWAAIEWPAAPVRVITWGAPIVSRVVFEICKSFRRFDAA